MSAGLYPPFPAPAVEVCGPPRAGGQLLAGQDGEPTALAVGMGVALIVVAYHLSLTRLFDLTSSDTPLAYVGLIPPVVLAVSILKGRRQPGELRLPDRQVDWIIGLPLLGVAVALAVLLPHRLSYQFWTNRLDLLGLPFFTAGAIALLLGSRVLYRVRFPVAALILAWPYPLELALNRLLPATSDLSLQAVRVALPVLGSARAVGGPLFSLGEGARRFTVNVAPACAGANGAVGFLLIAIVALVALRGRRTAKMGWILAGVALMLALNVGRLLLLFWVGGRYGQVAAIKWLHPYVGMVLFAAGMVILIWLLPRFGLRSRPGPDGPNDDSGRGPRTKRTVTGPTVTVIAVVGLLLGWQNHHLSRYDPFLIGSASGGPGISGAPPTVPGWSVNRYDDVIWAKQFFGESSTWLRYAYTPLATSPSRPSDTVFMDVVSTADLGSFSRYGLEKCYLFHQYRIVNSGRVALASGVDGQFMTYRAPHGRPWSVVSWVAPVSSGREKHFERITLLSPSSGVASTGDTRATGRHLESFARYVLGHPRSEAAPGIP